MTPLEIRIALHYHSSPEEWDAVYNGGEMTDRIIASLVEAGLLERRKLVTIYPERDKFQHVATDGLRVYVEALEAVPLPTRRWVMP